MKRFLYTSLKLLIALSLFTGCASMPQVSLPNISGSTQKSDANLYAKVPASMRADVKEAQFDLKKANENMKRAEEEFKLAQLKKEREILRTKYADHNQQLAVVLQKKADMRVEIKKVEAIYNSNLGDKENNIKKIANLKTKKLSIESDAIRIKANMDTTQLKIKQLTKKIILRERRTKK